MHIRLPVVAACLSTMLVLAGPVQAQGGNSNVGEFSLLFWTPDPELVLESGSLTAATGIDSVDFVQEFGIESKRFPEFRFAVGRGHRFRLSYVPVKYDAEAVIRRTITFRGQTFTLGAPATTTIEWDLWRIGYQWNVVSTNGGFLGIIADLKYNRLDAGIDSPVLSRAVTTEQRAPIPTIGVAGRAYPHPMVGISAEFSGLKVDFSEFEGKFLDFDVNGIVTFGPYVGVQAGYRQVTVEYLVDDDFGDLKLKGPYVGGIVKF